MFPLEAFAGHGAASPAAHRVPWASRPQPAGPVVAPAGLRHIPSAGAVQAPGAADPQQLCKTGLILANAKRLQKVSSEHCWGSALSFEGSALPAYPGIAGCFALVFTPTLQTPHAPISGDVHYSKQFLKSQRCGDGSSLLPRGALCHWRHFYSTESTAANSPLGKNHLGFVNPGGSKAPGQAQHAALLAPVQPQAEPRSRFGRRGASGLPATLSGAGCWVPATHMDSRFQQPRSRPCSGCLGRHL